MRNRASPHGLEFIWEVLLEIMASRISFALALPLLLGPFMGCGLALRARENL